MKIAVFLLKMSIFVLFQGCCFNGFKMCNSTAVINQSYGLFFNFTYVCA